MPAQPSWDDLNAFLNPDEFASLGTFTLADGTVLEDIAGVFEEPGESAALGTFEQDTTRPTFTCKWSDVSRVRRGDALVVEGGNYEAHKTPRRTGDGFAVVILEPSL
ncbi:hypothetical protein [Paraburkholderia sp.]|uniref:head-tail joining protein n=1 Tax=Paraburkholderia sp. TaxID=1926495 RepID=UPI0025DBA580|nr:hypothetical protein [Paraburkholderia sp.]